MTAVRASAAKGVLLRRPGSGAVPVPLSYSPEPYLRCNPQLQGATVRTRSQMPGVCGASILGPQRGPREAREAVVSGGQCAEWPPVPTLATRPGCPSITGACPLHCEWLGFGLARNRLWAAVWRDGGRTRNSDADQVIRSSMFEVV